ncbi:MAG: hypothetical protein KGD60_11560 [Candidatus Thorarchaeota archaeon]|nr:hypothetical protein [Candidatus Thorarchaeota archaeon]
MIVDLKAKYNEAVSKQDEKLDSDDVTTLIYRTPWVRILLDRDSEENKVRSIEVEISLPETIETDKSDSSEIIDRLSEHLQYLQHLREYGFELSVIGTGCIYCASKEIQDIPEDNVFRALLPP